MNIDLLAASPYVAYLSPLLVVGMFLTQWGGFKLNRGTATKTIVDSAAGAVKILRSECDELEKDLADARKQIKGLTADLAGAQAEVADLRGQVDRMSKDLAASHTELAMLRSAGGGRP